MKLENLIAALCSISRFKGRVAGIAPPPQFGWKILQRKVKFMAVITFRAAPPFLDRIVDKNSNEGLHMHPAFENF